MPGSPVARKRNTQCRIKVKTGCTTCRTRKVKCDENKPLCQKCVNTGRNCDGYESPFRLLTSQNIDKARMGSIALGTGIAPMRPTSTEIDLLNRYFSTKTMFDVKLACSEEAKQVLEASLNDPAIRHAILSLRALREDFETSGYVPTSVTKQTPSYGYGLQQYCMALRGLASKLLSYGTSELKSALLCCQIFISIEQVRGNFGAMAQHMIQGLRIMHEYRVRPNLVATDELVPAHFDQLPFLDVFIIKLFAAPCKFRDPPATAGITGVTASRCPVSPQQQPLKSHHSCTIAPNMRTGLTKIASLTLKFLDKVSRVESAETAVRLLPEKVSLLNYLESWLIDLEATHRQVESPGPEPISVSFLRFFHQIQRIILLGTLNFSPDLYAELRTQTDRLQDIANEVGERVKAYRMRDVTSSGGEERSRLR